MNFELAPHYKLSNDWYHQLTYSAFMVYHASVPTTLKFEPAQKRTIVEIGVFEGASACWWSDNLLDHPESRLYSIDPFTGSEEHHASPETRALLPSLEATARSNIAKSRNASKVHIIKGCSWDVFASLRHILDQQVDLLYIDGAHDAVSISRDTALYYPLVRNGGAIIWDDYTDAECVRAIDGCITTFCNLRERHNLHGQAWGVKG